MDVNQKVEFCKAAADYVGLVAMHLADKMGEQQASIRVLEHLALVLENMFDQTRPDDMAWSLIPQPHNFPMPPK